MLLGRNARLIPSYSVPSAKAEPKPRPISRPAIPEPNRPKPKSPPNLSRRDSPLDGPRNGPSASNLSRMNTYAKNAANPRGMRSSKIIRLKVPCNQHLQKTGGGESYCYPAATQGRELHGKPAVSHAAMRMRFGSAIMRMYLAPRPDRRLLGA